MSNVTVRHTPVKALSFLLISLSLALITHSAVTAFSVSSSRTLAATTQTLTLTYPLLNGWNLVHFPLIPDNFTTAAELVRQVAQSGGYVTVVATWEDGHWQEYVQRGATAYSPDYPLKPGQAYFLRSHRQGNWQVTGTPTSVPPLNLIPGWNSLGLFLTRNQTAVTVLDALNASSSPDNATEIDWWNSGNWEVLVKRTYSPQDIQQYGTNFIISPQLGYMIKVKDFINLTLTD